MAAITRFRGDTHPLTFALTDNATPAVAIDITGFSFLLTVDPGEEPTDAVNNVFSIAGVIVSGVGGTFKFTLTTGQADNLGEFFYDIELIDAASAIRTIAKDTWTWTQDITKT